MSLLVGFGCRPAFVLIGVGASGPAGVGGCDDLSLIFLDERGVALDGVAGAPLCSLNDAFSFSFGRGGGGGALMSGMSNRIKVGCEASKPSIALSTDLREALEVDRGGRSGRPCGGLGSLASDDQFDSIRRLVCNTNSTWKIFSVPAENC